MRRQSLYVVGPCELAWVDEQLPPLQPHEALLKTLSGAISIGSELPLYKGDGRYSAPLMYPLTSGYENVAEVLAVGADVRDFCPGARVVAFYGHRTHAIIPAAKAICVPDDISDELALLSILTCDVAKGIRKLNPMPEESILITGAGAIGLLTLFVLRAYGVRHVDIAEPRAERREMALKMGARQALSPEALVSESYTAAFECSSRDAAFHILQHALQTGGRACILADGNYEPLTLAPEFHTKELSLVASSDGWDYQRHAQWYFDQIREEPYALEKIFDQQIVAQDLIATFEQLAETDSTPVKVLVRYAPGA